MLCENSGSQSGIDKNSDLLDDDVVRNVSERLRASTFRVQ